MKVLNEFFGNPSKCLLSIEIDTKNGKKLPFGC